MATLTHAQPLQFGALPVDPPVVLAPMAGITTSAYRRVCRQYGAGLYVSEMITSRALVERTPLTMQMLRFHESETPRSVQLYAVDPAVVGEAVRILVDEDRAEHIDLNMGCPVPKVTRKGGGAALPWRRNLFRAIIGSAVQAAAGRVPVTVKMRKGIDPEHETYLEAGRIAQEEGITAVALHGRTAAQMYGGTADWSAIAALVAELDVPVLGNGDIWEANDALAMTEQTGCAGVVVGRGCLGRPWLFADLANAFAGRPDRLRPKLSEVAGTMREHAAYLAEDMGEQRGARDFRKHVSWYLKGFRVGSELRQQLGLIGDLADLDRSLNELLEQTGEQDYPESIIGLARGRSTGTRKVTLPEGWLEDRDTCAVPFGAEIDVSGG
ncbi:tRNA dihydrouridine synthase DusB [Epidermidibacterium keratini]|uniref:tRNA-dihydrouridine synthase n=1 Tax=Epidermidibacterium keratini TaxID=1891644 RepID=A0A7L4YKH8_9ACTN|nr:tRNA dihydrouridine synthase DusB [Epidermidibacterium keratini]QHB99318.1 tRNA dihydrouridine synthase DusB [Epidermidibacterium keratini]